MTICENEQNRVAAEIARRVQELAAQTAYITATDAQIRNDQDLLNNVLIGPPTPIYSPRGRRGIGVIQPQSGLDYPFVNPSEDIRYLVADFYFEYEQSPSNLVLHPLRILWLYGVGQTPNFSFSWAPISVNAADIVLIDANDRIIFNSTAPDGAIPKKFSTRDWGDDYTIYEWRGVDTVCRLVAYKTIPPDFTGDTAQPTNLAPESAVLDERAVYKMPRRVTSLTTALRTLTETDVNFISGYNITTTTNPVARGLRRSTQLVVNAVPGAGYGKYSDCTDEPAVISSINGLTGPDITIDASDCLWLKVAGAVNPDTGNFVPERTSYAGTVVHELSSNCPACCSCDDFVDTAEYMNTVRDVYKNIGDRAHVVLLKHSDNILRWIEDRACRIRRPIKLAMTPQRCPTMDIVVQYCNLCEKCEEDIVIAIQVDVEPYFDEHGNPPTGYINQCYSLMSAGKAQNAPFLVGGSWPIFYVNFGSVSQGSAATASFRLHIDPGIPRLVQLTATATSAGAIIRDTCDNTGNRAVAKLAKPLACTVDHTTLTVCG